MAYRRRRRIEESFQMAPMIDMVFLLLVFFMTVSTIAKESRPELELAVSTTAAIPESAPPRDFITIRQEENLRYFWGNKPVHPDDLPELLENRSRSGGEQLVLRAGPELPWEIWQELLRQCRQANISEVVFATFED